MQQAMDCHGFTRIVALNEAAKGLLALSQDVRLLAINAVPQSRRGGDALRGFGAVAAQMGEWTRELHARLQSLDARCAAVVARTSLYSREARVLRLLEATARMSEYPAMQDTVRRSAAAQASLRASLEGDWQQIRSGLADLDQLGTLAVVLSRSAMIEAATGNAEQRALLGQVSQDFSRLTQLAVQTVKRIIRQVRGD